MAGPEPEVRSQVLRRLFALVVIAAVPLLGGVAAAQEPSYERAVDLTFPVAGPVQYSEAYHADRSGGARKHQATDLMGTKLQTLHAVVDGTICFVTGLDEPMPSWGYALTICGDDGLEYGYLHINNDNPGTDDGLGGPAWAYAPGVRRGLEVRRGDFVAYLGDSGNAEGTGAHLHFEIFDPELEHPDLAATPYKQGRLNPFPSLEAARLRGDLPGAPRPAGPSTPSPTPTASAPAAPEPLRRLAGGTRIETALLLAASMEQASTVVVVPAGSPAEALVAAPLAGLVEAPVLLSDVEGLPEAALDAVRRLGVRNAYVVGRTDQLSTAVEDGLRESGITGIARIAEPDAASLSAAVAAEIASYGEPGETDEVVLALGEADDPMRTWPDALSAAAPAARAHRPILLTRTTDLPRAVARVLAELAPDRITVVGGPAAVSPDVARHAGRAAGGAEVERLAGATRYATSVAVAERARTEGLDAEAVWIATGLAFPDALAAGPAAARAGAPIVLVDGLDPSGSPESHAWLAEREAAEAVVVGGPVAVSDAVRDRVASALR